MENYKKFVREYRSVKKALQGDSTSEKVRRGCTSCVKGRILEGNKFKECEKCNGTGILLVKVQEVYDAGYDYLLYGYKGSIDEIEREVGRYECTLGELLKEIEHLITCLEKESNKRELEGNGKLYKQLVIKYKVLRNYI